MPKCFICNLKISKIMKEIYTCKCKKIYCSKHLHDHICSYPHKKDYQDILRAKLPVIKKQKIIKI